ncbi:ABC transporter substrate-binding protein [Allostreptomyces psammosilenae]|uniref:ABC-type glycerol-3-phosphate transport system substrate-binding protein n=1 Tax=Allostreptomyces psammosilenae TaxID=1892865 RepID=A0A852ZQZ6_9ACTN|nr:extracellular solute-binding protein [Allostreptomyces psammosilenae]NYI03917.1 ABC-type glycerol-3-phosphate transport system substrate-binding protein [Allostreptomyces psammosilenae]
MRRRLRGLLVGFLSATLATTAVTGCSSAPGGAPGDVTITVAGLPPATQPNVRRQFLEQVAAFEEANPGIDVQPTETEWEARTFAARLAGGRLETVLRVPLTEPARMFARGQIADITAEAAALPHADAFDRRALAPVTDPSGRLFGLPVSEYALGLVYNRELFARAGLDPERPPATWEEVRRAAAAVWEATGVAGFAMPTTNNTGGWVLTAMTYTHGGRMEQEVDGATVATFDTEPARAALDLLRAMRWEDASMGTQHLRNAADIGKDFAAGRVAMMVATPSFYVEHVTQYGGDPAAYGMAALPSAGTPATLLGGDVAVVSPTATAEERAAAVAWIDFYYLKRKYDPAFAETVAASLAADDVPVGFPTVPLYGPEVTEPARQAELRHANVPVENFRPFETGLAEQEFVTEPPVAAQEAYAALDAAVQAVLTRQDADPAAELRRAQEKAAPALARDQR